MTDVHWDCLKCKKYNVDSLQDAEDNTVMCNHCYSEFILYLDISVKVKSAEQVDRTRGE